MQNLSLCYVLHLSCALEELSYGPRMSTWLEFWERMSLSYEGDWGSSTGPSSWIIGV